MKNLTKLLTIFACFAVAATAVNADEAKKDEARNAIAAQLPEGVSLSDATEQQLAEAIVLAIEANTEDADLLAAIEDVGEEDFGFAVTLPDPANNVETSVGKVSVVNGVETATLTTVGVNGQPKTVVIVPDAIDDNDNDQGQDQGQDQDQDDDQGQDDDGIDVDPDLEDPSPT